MSDERTPAQLAREAADQAAAEAAAAQALADQAARAFAEAAEAEAVAAAQAERDRIRSERYGNGVPYEGLVFACLPCGVAVVDRDVHNAAVHYVDDVDWRQITDPVKRREARAIQMRRR